MNFHRIFFRHSGFSSSVLTDDIGLCGGFLRGYHQLKRKIAGFGAAIAPHQLTTHALYFPPMHFILHIPSPG
jgi:hypothetical protein